MGCLSIYEVREKERYRGVVGRDRVLGLEAPGFFKLRCVFSFVDIVTVESRSSSTFIPPSSSTNLCFIVSSFIRLYLLFFCASISPSTSAVQCVARWNKLFQHYRSVTCIIVISINKKSMALSTILNRPTYQRLKNVHARARKKGGTWRIARNTFDRPTKYCFRSVS